MTAASLTPRKGKAIALLAAVTIGWAAPPPAAAQQVIAVIVNRSNPLDGISAESLRKLYLGTSTVFANKVRVVLYEETDLRDAFYRAALQMNGDRVKRHWISVVFTGLDAKPPRSIDEQVQLLELVVRERGAIGFVDARAVDSSVKLLLIDGLRPGDPGYPLRADSVSHAR